MTFLIFCLCFFGVYSQQVAQETKNHTTLPSVRTARQYGPPPVAEQIFKPTGYPYPSSQKLQFSHDNKLHIYLFQNKLSLYCATDTTYEKITWKKYACPNHIGTQNGETVAVGPMVPNPNLYGINSFGRNEEYVSELLLKQPLTPHTDGAYVCEGVFISDKYPYDATSTVRDIIIVGGKSLYQNCFNSRNIKRSTTNHTSNSI